MSALNWGERPKLILILTISSVYRILTINTCSLCLYPHPPSLNCCHKKIGCCCHVYFSLIFCEVIPDVITWHVSQTVLLLSSSTSLIMSIPKHISEGKDNNYCSNLMFGTKNDENIVISAFFSVCLKRRWLWLWQDEIWRWRKSSAFISCTHHPT